MRLLLQIVIASLLFAVTAVPSPAMAMDAVLVWAQRNQDNTFSINLTARENQDWSRRFTLSKSGQPEAAPVVISDGSGNIWVVWVRLVGMTGTIYYRFFSGPDGQWRKEEPIKTVTSSDLAPSLGIDDTGSVWLAYSGTGEQGDDIYLCRWNGSTWDRPFPVNRGNSTPDILPTFVTDAGQHLVLLWKGLRQGNYMTMRSVFVRGTWSEEEPLPAVEKQRMDNLSALKDEGDPAASPLPAFAVPRDQAAIWSGNRKQRISTRIQHSSP